MQKGQLLPDFDGKLSCEFIQIRTILALVYFCVCGNRHVDNTLT